MRKYLLVVISLIIACYSRAQATPAQLTNLIMPVSYLVDNAE